MTFITIKAVSGCSWDNSQIVFLISYPDLRKTPPEEKFESGEQTSSIRPPPLTGARG